MVDDILSSIPDDLLLSEVTEENVAVYNLYHNYLTIQNNLAVTHMLTSESTGADLKFGVRTLNNELKLKLINQFFIDQKQAVGLAVDPGIATTDMQAQSPVDRIWSDVVLRRWIVKSILIFLFVMLLLVVGAAIAIGFLTGTFTDGVFVNTIMNTAVEILKLIFGTE